MLKSKLKKRLLTMLTAVAMMLVFALPASAALDTTTLPDNVEATVYKDGEYPDLSMADDAMDGIGTVTLSSGEVVFTLPVKSITFLGVTGYIVGVEIPAFGTLGTDYTVTAPSAPYSTGNLVISGVDSNRIYANDADTGEDYLYQNVKFDVQLSYGTHIDAVADMQLDVQVTP